MRLPTLCTILLAWSGSALTAASPNSSGKAPEHCRKLPTDNDWPSVEVWNSELKGNEKLMPSKLKHPDYIYEASKVEHVQKAVKFVAKHNVRLSIINAGHDFMGRNDAPSGLLLTVSGLKGIRVLESFTPTTEGAEAVSKTTKANVIKPVPGKQAAVTFGAGITTKELNLALIPSGLIALGAAHGDVSVAGGWAQGGGHSSLSGEHGLGADSVLEYKVVTAKGDLVVANAVTNQDLFWALRGGGGGTWGVVVESTVKAFNFPKVAMRYRFWLNTTDFDDRNSIFDAAAHFCSQTPKIYDNRINGYLFVYPNAVRGTFVGLGDMADAKNLSSFMEPIVNKMASMKGMSPKSLNRLVLPEVGNSASIFSYVQEMFTPKSAGKTPARLSRRHNPGESVMVSSGILTMDSRLLGKAEIESPNLAMALNKALPKDLPDGQLRLHVLTGGQVHKLGNDTSVNPAFRKAYLHVVATGVGKAIAQSLRDFAPNTGAYINEGWYKNPDWKNTFWGSNYPRLSQIKEKWDPDMMFYVTPGVNADTMIVKDGRVCKVSGQNIRTASGEAPPGDNENLAMGYMEEPSFPMLFQGKNTTAKFYSPALFGSFGIPVSSSSKDGSKGGS